jgi:chlorophyll synthase
MADSAPTLTLPARPAPGAVLELLKPVTWFPPMWAFACGIVSSGVSVTGHLLLVFAGVVLAGPLVCATSQAVNDWFDRHVDAINEPNRPIPSGRIPGRWGLWIALAWTGLSVAVAAALGPWVLGAAIVGLALAWAYSAPPFRLKQNGWWGNTAVAVCYEGLPWITGAAVMIAGRMPDWHVFVLAALYSAGAHGIMTVNDFKSIDGDRRMGIRSIPAQLGAERAARLCCVVMIVPQLAVIAALWSWDRPVHAGIVVGLVVLQLFAMAKMLEDPRGRAPWFNGTGIMLYVLGMMVSAFAIRPFAGGGL